MSARPGFNTHDVGDRIVVRARFRHPTTGADLDPDTVKLLVQKPSGAIAVHIYGDGPAVVRDQAGQYHAEIDIDEPAEHDKFWVYRWLSTGNGQAAAQRRFQARPGIEEA